MNFPDELCNDIVKYMRIEEQLQVRLTSKQGRDSVQNIEENDDRPIYGKIYHWRQCYPRAKYLNTLGHLVREDEFKYFKGIEHLQLGCVLANENLFGSCDKLKTLTLHTRRNATKPVEDSMFAPLSELLSLSLYDSTLTDQIFNYMPQLEELSLVNCENITSNGIRSISCLKRLFLFEQIITDDAFEGLGLEELAIHYDDVITDQGIQKLTQLQILRCSNTRIQFRFGTMPKLHSLHLIRTSIEYSTELQHIRHLTLQFCYLKGPAFEWKNLETLELLDTTLEAAPAILTLLQLPKLKRITLVHCPQLEQYEDALSKRFILMKN